MKGKVRKGKSESYLKFILWMVVGGAFGMVAGIVFAMTGRNVEVLVENARSWMSRSASLILVILLVIAVVFCILCYRKGETLLKKLQGTQEDEQVEKLEDVYDFWGNIGLTGSGIIMYIAIAVYAFDICGENLTAGEGMFQGLIGTVVFILVTLVCGFYQVILTLKSNGLKVVMKGKRESYTKRDTGRTYLLRQFYWQLWLWRC